MVEDDFNPDSILTDFESGTIKSIRKLFPNVVHKGNDSSRAPSILNNFVQFVGCLFHFGQCIWRRLQAEGLKNKYHEDKCFHLNIRKLLALAFVPISDVVKAFELIVDDFSDDCDPFLDYFEKTWIGERKKRGKQENDSDARKHLSF